MNPDRRNFILFYSSSFTWNVALGLTYLLIPLQAHHLGMSGLTVGSLIALPVVLQFILNLAGGAWADRIGGRAIMIASFIFTVVAAGTFAVTNSFAGLLAAQILMVVARAIYWPASWSIASQMPGDPSRQMGHLNAIGSAGQIGGTVGAGLIIAWWGFGAGFWIMLALGVASVVLGSLFSFRLPPRAGEPQSMMATFASLLKRRSIYFGCVCAYLSALPFSLSVSFYPILLVEQGFNSDANGLLMAIRALGSIAAGMVVARFVTHAGARSVPLVSGLVTALSIALVAAVHQPALIALFLLGVGLGSGVMTIYFQVLTTSLTAADQRGSAMALAGTGWSISHFTSPLAMGWLTDLYGIQMAFYGLGAFAALASLALAPLHRWSFRDGRAI